MIQKLLSAAFIAAAISASAQQLQISTIGMENVSYQTSFVQGVNPSIGSVAVDTLKPVSIKPGGCAVGTDPALKGLASYVIDRTVPRDSGYYYGTNIFPQVASTTQEVAQKYNVAGAATVTDVLVWAAVASGSTATTTANIYTENPSTHKPDALLGTSTDLPMSSYMRFPTFTKFSFATAVNVPAGNFFVSVTVPPFGGSDLDTLAILTTKFGCPVSGDSLSAIKLKNYGWYLTKTLFRNYLDVMVFPIINNNTTGINNSVSSGDLSLYGASPNPASNAININFSLSNASKVEIEVYDITGKIVKTIKGNEFATGKSSVSVDLLNLESGSYIYSISSNTAKLFSKFVVAK